MISRCSERNAIENGSERGPDDMLTKPSEMPGNRISNASAVMPPIDGPDGRHEPIDAEMLDDLEAAARDVLERQHRET